MKHIVVFIIAVLIVLSIGFIFPDKDAWTYKNADTGRFECGGSAGVVCPDDYVCVVTGGADFGVCVEQKYQTICNERSDECTLQYDPVCGSDGKTYGNDCVACSGGVGWHVPGPCPVQNCVLMDCGGLKKCFGCVGDECTSPMDNCEVFYDSSYACVETSSGCSIVSSGAKQIIGN